MSSTLTLILNNNNLIGTNNNTYQYNFLNGCFNIKEDSSICISQITIPYSWYNINSGLYNNNSFQYTFSGSTFTFTLSDGFYGISDISQALQNYMISQNQYLINTSTGIYQYFIVLASNTTYYANQILTFPIPSSLPTGYTAPSGFVYSSGGYTPQIIITSNSFGKLIGFSSGTYPSTLQSSSYNVLSNITPNASPVNSLIVRCNLVSNEATMPSDILDSFNINATFGSQITYSPSYEKWVSIKPGTYNNFIITFQDQNFGIVQINDPNILIALMIKQGKKKIIPPYHNIVKQINRLKFSDDDEE